MKNESPYRDSVNGAPTPTPVDRATFEAEIDSLRAREKAHIRQGDEIAAARRRLPVVEVDAGLELIGPDGPVTLLDTFEGRRQLLAYYFMWNPGKSAPEQCEGCTWVTTQVQELSYLHSRDIPSRSSVRVPTTKAPGIAISWTGICPGTQRFPHSRRSWSVAPRA